MAIFSNHWFFPVTQLALLCAWLYAVWRDYPVRWQRKQGGVQMTVTRGEESMRTLDKVTGVVIAAVITIINKSVFDEDGTWNVARGTSASRSRTCVNS